MRVKRVKKHGNIQYFYYDEGVETTVDKDKLIEDLFNRIETVAKYLMNKVVYEGVYETGKERYENVVVNRNEMMVMLNGGDELSEKQKELVKGSDK